MNPQVDIKALQEKLVDIIFSLILADDEKKIEKQKKQAIEIINNKDFRAHINDYINGYTVLDAVNKCRVGVGQEYLETRGLAEIEKAIKKAGGKTSEQPNKNLSLAEIINISTQRLIDAYLNMLKINFRIKIHTTDFIDNEFIDWKEKINPFSAAILSHDIGLVNYYLHIRESERQAIRLGERRPDLNASSELMRCNVDLQNVINHKIQGDLKNKIWDNVVKPYVGYTPLHLAVHKGFSEVVDILLKESDIDPNVKNNEGLTPLELALKLDQPNSVKIIKALLNDPRVEHNQNELPLLIENCSIDLIDAFLQDSNTEQSTKDEILSKLYKNPKPLFYAIQKRNLNIIDKFLKNKDIDLNIIKNDEGLTLLEFAINSIGEKSYDTAQLMKITGIAYKLALDPRSEFNEAQKTKLINAHNKIKYQLIKPIAQLLLFSLSFVSCSCLCIAYAPTGDPIAAALVITSSVIFAIITFAMICSLLPNTISIICTINGANKELKKSYQGRQDQFEANDKGMKTEEMATSHLSHPETVNQSLNIETTLS